MQKKKRERTQAGTPSTHAVSLLPHIYLPSPSFCLFPSCLRLPAWMEQTRNFTTLGITHVHSPEANQHFWALILNFSILLVYQPRPATTSQGDRVSLTGWPKVNFPVLHSQGLRWLFSVFPFLMSLSQPLPSPSFIFCLLHSSSCSCPFQNTGHTVT